MKYLELEGSDRSPLPGFRALGPVHPALRLEVTLVLKPENDKLDSFFESTEGKSLLPQTHLTEEEFTTNMGVSVEDVRKIRQIATRFGLRVIPDPLVRKTGSNALALRTVELRGTARAFSRAFKVRLRRYKNGRATYVGFTGRISIPDSIAAITHNVFGLDTRDQAAPCVRVLQRLGGFHPAFSNTFYTPDEVSKLYNFPGATGKGECIAIIELGGGFRRRDLERYFRGLGIAMPVISTVALGKRNHPTGNPNSADAEVMLDIEVAGAISPRAKIVVYFARNRGRGFFRALNAAVHDQKNRPSVISISWGAPEEAWTARDMQSFTTAFKAAAALGITVCCASGDSGSSYGVPGRMARVGFPASSPFTTSCGGTHLESQGAAISKETVWNDGPEGGASGGGISAFFPVPHYQAAAGLPKSANRGAGAGRGVPDVAANSDPATGYKVRVDGVDVVVGGTSAAAPLWSALAARMNEELGHRVGFLNPSLYKMAHSGGGAFHDVTTGNNDNTGQIGGYSARKGWDACTGLGTPHGKAIMTGLQAKT